MLMEAYWFKKEINIEFLYLSARNVCVGWKLKERLIIPWFLFTRSNKRKCIIFGHIGPFNNAVSIGERRIC